MKSHWDAGRQAWEIFVDDPLDPALDEYGFPEEARRVLRDPSGLVEHLAPTEAISVSFARRIRTFVGAEMVQVVCHADADETQSLRRPRIKKPGNWHFAIIGPDWTDWKPRKPSLFSRGEEELPEWMKAVSVPLDPGCASAPAWDSFPRVSEAFRVASERLAGVVQSSISHPYLGVVHPCSAWEKSESHRDVALGAGGRPDDVPAEPVLWHLQRSYYGVSTLLLEPGYLVQTDPHGDARVLVETDPGEWLAAELEEGTRGQPPRVSESRWR